MNFNSGDNLTAHEASKGYPMLFDCSRSMAEQCTQICTSIQMAIDGCQKNGMEKWNR